MSLLFGFGDDEDGFVGAGVGEEISGGAVIAAEGDAGEDSRV